jgi:hypothetical protein
MAVCFMVLLLAVQLGCFSGQGQPENPKLAPDAAQLEAKGKIKWIMIGSESEVPSFVPAIIKDKIPSLLKSYAKDNKFGVVIGMVSALSKKQLSGVNVEMSGPSLLMGSVRSVLTDKDGIFIHYQLRAGNYTCIIHITTVRLLSADELVTL